MKMRKNRKMFFLASMLFMLALSACGTRKPSLTGDMVITSVAQTVQADLTKVAASIPTSTPTPVASPTSTNEPFTPTPTATFTPTGPTYEYFCILGRLWGLGFFKSTRWQCFCAQPNLYHGSDPDEHR
jgi:hypothetical protein